MTKSSSSHKFLQSIDDDYFYVLGKAARTRGVTVQELIRAVIIPDWISKARQQGNLGTVKASSAKFSTLLRQGPILDVVR